MTMMRDRRREARLQREHESDVIQEQLEQRTWHPPHPVAWAWLLVSTLLLFGLSYWQVERMIWKEGLLADIDKHQLTRAYGGLPEDNAITQETLSFGRIRLEGTFLHEDELHLAARYYHSQLGYHILTPFMLTDGRMILMNRGWVPVDQKDASTREVGQLSGVQHITAMVRTDNDRNYFTPEHDISDNIWFWKDLDTASDVTGYDFVPVNMDVLYTKPAGGLPIPSDGLIRLRNDHLSYAITWCLIGISGIIIFIFYHYRQPHSPT